MVAMGEMGLMEYQEHLEIQEFQGQWDHLEIQVHLLLYHHQAQVLKVQ
jgi:hypothetical protein